MIRYPRLQNGRAGLVLVWFVLAGAVLDRFNNDLIRDLLCLTTFLARSGYPLGPPVFEKVFELRETNVSGVSMLTYLVN